jgi:hypothetical protein
MGERFSFGFMMHESKRKYQSLMKMRRDLMPLALLASDATHLSFNLYFKI